MLQVVGLLPELGVCVLFDAAFRKRAGTTVCVLLFLVDPAFVLTFFQHHTGRRWAKASFFEIENTSLGNCPKCLAQSRLHASRYEKHYSRPAWSIQTPELLAEKPVTVVRMYLVAKAPLATMPKAVLLGFVFYYLRARIIQR